MGVRPTVVSGSSIGALVGGAYASGQLDSLERWVRSLTWKDILGYMDLSLLEGGLIQGAKLLDIVRSSVTGTTIESLPLSFGAVATDLDTGREVWFRDGPLLDAVRASIALPGLFTPVKINGRWLVDGGLVDPTPVSLCRAMGAEVVIAVNLNGDIVGKHSRRRDRRHAEKKAAEIGETALWERVSGQLKNSLHESRVNLLSQLFGRDHDTPGLFEVMAGSINIMQDRITRSRMAGDPPEVLLAPRLARLGLMEFDKAATAIEEGRACVRRAGPALEQALIGY